ncbi:MAG: ComEC/Rec2 family competence protein [Spirochaetales bacterium]|nr:ComEC/Rec2 family competence protein [Spirochaetales bacterium]
MLLSLIFIPAGILLFLIPFGCIRSSFWLKFWFSFFLFSASLVTGSGVVSSVGAGLSGGVGGVPWDMGRQGTLNMTPTAIVKLRAFISGDSVPLSGRGTFFTVQSPLCLDVWGNSADSRGAFSIIMSEERQFYDGQEVLITGSFLPSTAEAVSEHFVGASEPSLFMGGRVKSTGLWRNARSKLRASLLKKIDFGFFAGFGEAGGFLKALLLGIRDDLGSLLLMNFKRAGVMHILALSGMHLGLLTGILSLILIPLAGKRWTYPFIMIFLVFYLFLAGCKVSLLRAFFMFSISGLASYTGRRMPPLRSLGISFFIMTLITPSGIFSPGFQLSFAALGGIFLIGLPLGRLFSSRLPSIIFYPLGVSLGAQMATLPILLFHFHEWVPSGILCSLILTPLITLFIWIGLLLLILSGFYPFFLIRLFSIWFKLLYTLISKTVEYFSGLPSLIFSESVAYFWCFFILLLLVLGGIMGVFRRGFFEYKLRLSQGTAGSSGFPGICHVEEVRPELSCESECQGEDNQASLSGTG